MGMGIWSMHYIGMLALSLPIPVSYDVSMVALSLLAAILASATALFVVSRKEMSRRQEVLGSVAMGGGIATMHYIGMAAMRCPSTIRYNAEVVGFSIVVAVGISLIALQLAFRLRSVQMISWQKAMGAVAMGGAIASMHYTGMWAATFYPSSVAVDLTNAVTISNLGLFSISAGSVLVIAGAIAFCMLDRFMTSQRGNLNIARERELYFQTMAEAIPEIIWTANPDGLVDYCNQNILAYSGLPPAQIQGEAWLTAIHPDDRDLCLTKWKEALSAAEKYEVQYRLRRRDGVYRWFLCRANPIRDHGTIVKWFGTCTDIESQKLNEQVLEQQILERTMQLADANERLEKEMAEREHARKQLDDEHEKSMKDLEQRSERAAMLAKMGELLQSCISRDEVIAVALSFAPKIFPASRGSVFLLNESRALAELAGSWSECQLPSMDFETSDCWALRTGHLHLVYADDTTARCKHAAELQCSHLCVPILAQGEALGVLHTQAKQIINRLDPAELSFRMTFAGQIGLSIANIKLRDALRTQSIRDALTGLYNRRYLDEILEREFRRSSRSQQRLGIIIIDLDHFKNFNDAFGHDAGDAVLRETGQLLTKYIRAEDFVCRYGGEEFVVILPTANLQAAHGRAENLRLKMRQLTILYQGKPMGMITISAGVAVFPDQGVTPQEVIAAADAALYEAKRNGRDQVVIASTQAGEETELSTSAKSASGLLKS